MHYYLPSPENMLSHQTHWDNAVIPHSCLYHTVVSPLAVFPRIWFYSLEKIVLAGMLAMMVLAASVLATCFGDKRAGVWAGVFVITLPPSFQLLGLGHLMTLFGMWTATLALSLLVLRFENLKERTTWWWATIALTICFLSYTASLLFAGVVVALTVSLLYRQAPGPTRALAGISVLAAATAFLLYYVHWTSPFLTEALPKLFDHSTFQGGASIWNRVLTLPGRLSFTYQNVWLPLFGLAGLSLAPQSPETDLPLLVGRYPHLVQWAGIAIQLPPQAPLLRDGAGECRPGPRRGLAIGKRARRGDRSGHFSGPSGHPGVPECPGRGHGKRLRNTLAQIQPSCPITIQTTPSCAKTRPSRHRRKNCASRNQEKL